MSSNEEPNAPTESANSNTESRPTSLNMVFTQLISNKVDALLFATRLVAIIASLVYIVPLFGAHVQYSAYQKALLAFAASSALRLHQRLPPFRMTGEFATVLMTEDSAHYLVFSLIFLYSKPIAMVVLPISLFATVSMLVFLIQVFRRANYTGIWFERATWFHETYWKNLLQIIALAEITIIPLIIVGLFTGVCSLLTIIAYYRFILMRYTSRRNAYTRAMFADLRFAVQRVAYHPSCPTLVRTIVDNMIMVCSRLGPNIQYAQ